jgi:hypothetical protein
MKTVRLCVAFALAMAAGANAEEKPASRIIEEIEFRFEPSFRDGTKIWLARTSEGKVLCAAYSVPEDETREVASKGVKKLKSAEVSVASFESFATALESSELREAAENTPPPGLDGTAWIFRKKVGSRLLEYRFWTPEGRPDVKSSALAMRLGKQIVEAAGVDSVFSAKKKPSQSPEPTR